MGQCPRCVPGDSGVPVGAVGLALRKYVLLGALERRTLATDSGISPLTCDFPCLSCPPTLAPCARSLCVFEDVHSLPCSHRFCRECIMGCFKSSKRQECPLCKVRGHCQKRVASSSFFIGLISASFLGWKHVCSCVFCFGVLSCSSLWVDVDT